MGNNTPGAFGKQNDPNAPSKKPKLIIRKLQPPPEIKKKIIEDDKKRESCNPAIRWLKKFFGVGF